VLVASAGEMRKYTENIGANICTTDRVGDICIEGKIIVKWILEK